MTNILRTNTFFDKELWQSQMYTLEIQLEEES